MRFGRPQPDLARERHFARAVPDLELDVRCLQRSRRQTFQRERLEARQERRRLEPEATKESRWPGTSQLGRQIEPAVRQTDLTCNSGLGLGEIADPELIDRETAIHRASREADIEELGAVPGQPSQTRFDKVSFTGKRQREPRQQIVGRLNGPIVIDVEPVERRVCGNSRSRRQADRHRAGGPRGIDPELDVAEAPGILHDRDLAHQAERAQPSLTTSPGDRPSQARGARRFSVTAARCPRARDCRPNSRADQ